MKKNNPYLARGTFTGQSYIERDADIQLRNAIFSNNKYPCFLAPRQSGKSSILERTRRLLANEDLKIIIVDLSLFSQKDIKNFSEFTFKFMTMIYNKLAIDNELQNQLRLLKRGPFFLRESTQLLLSSVKGRIVICIDEIDAIFVTKFKDDFFSQIRALFNERSSNPIFERIQFVLAGAVPQDSLISDRKRSPFNVGGKITLSDFNIDEIRNLVSVGDWLSSPDEIKVASERIKYWSNGSVFLSQSILEKAYRIRCETIDSKDIYNLINEIAAEIIISAQHEIHFRNIENQLRSQPHLLLEWKNWLNGLVPDIAIRESLYLAGISDEQNPIRNMIYRKVFYTGGTLSLFPETYNSFDYDVFLSYSSKDSKIVKALAERLNHDGLRVWLDAWMINPGDSISLKIQDGLERSKVFIPCMSRSYFDSKYNLLLFQDPTNTKRRLIPLLIEDCVLPNSVAQFAYIDWREQSEEAYRRLLIACTRDNFDPIVMSAEGEPSTLNLQNWAGGKNVTLAIVFTDVIGSIALGEGFTEKSMNEVRRAHFAQSRRLIDQFDGREIKTVGDSFMAAFRSVDAALDYAIALQRNTGHPKIQIRAGIHIGSVLVDEDDVFGGTVNFAARVVGAIDSSEIWLSDRAKKNVDLLSASRFKQLRWKIRDNVAMKGFPGSFTLWSVQTLHV